MEIADWIEKMKKERDEAIEGLRKACGEASAEKLFVATLLQMSVGPASEMSEMTHGTVPIKSEALAFHLFPLFGVSEKDITPGHVYQALEASQTIIAADSLLIDSARELDSDDAAGALARQIERQARTVRGSAYQEQTAKEIVEVQGRFDSWFENKIGISPTRAQEALWKIYEHVNTFLDENIDTIREYALTLGEEWQRIKKIRPKNRSDEDNLFMSAFPKREYAVQFGWVQKMSELGFESYPVHLGSLGFSDDEAAGLEVLIGLTSANRADISDVVNVKQRPLYILDDKRVLFVDVANAMDALWDAFGKVARSDQGFHDGKYQTHKGKWLESKVVEYLSRVFPRDRIYSGLAYPDLGRGAGATTELDIAVAFGPFLILSEGKAKQFRLEGQLGDFGRLRTDIRVNVQDAFDQAKRAADYIEATARPEFIETSSGRTLTIDKQNLSKVFLMTVSLHQLSGLATTLAVFQDFGLFGASEYPFSISIADLEFVTEFTAHPDVFLHYIEKRLEVQKLPIDFNADELDFLGAYLDTRFAKPYFWEKEGDFNAVALNGFSAVFDDLMMFRRGLLGEKPQIGLSLPEGIQEVLTQLRAADDGHSLKLAFEILGLPKEVLRAISQLLYEMRKMDNLTWGNIRRHALLVQDVVIVGIVAEGVPAAELVRRSKEIAKIERYRRRQSRSLAIAVAPKNRTSVFEWIDYADAPWAYDAAIERLMAAEPARAAVTPAKLPGPNAVCFCGSGRKFKKCCSARLVR